MFRIGITASLVAVLALASCKQRAFNQEQGSGDVASTAGSEPFLVMAGPTMAAKKDPNVQTRDDPEKKFHCNVVGTRGQRVPLASHPVPGQPGGHYLVHFKNPPCPLAEGDVYIHSSQILVTSDIFNCSGTPPLARGSGPQDLYDRCQDDCFAKKVVTDKIDKRFCEWPGGWGEALTNGAARPGTGRAFGNKSFIFDRLAGGHEGVDFGAGRGHSVLAIQDGAVVGVINRCPEGSEKMCGNGYGNMVIIHHGNGVYSRYCHLSATKVNLGDFVTKGQQVGAVGTSGWSDGDHLHMEVGTMSNLHTICKGPYAFEYNYNYDWLFPATRPGGVCQ